MSIIECEQGPNATANRRATALPVPPINLGPGVAGTPSTACPLPKAVECKRQILKPLRVSNVAWPGDSVGKLEPFLGIWRKWLK